MRSLIVLALLVASTAQGQSDIGNHGDPYNKKWRSEKLKTRQILLSMKVEYLLPSTSPEARAELSKIGPQGESMFVLMEKELAASELVFRKKGESNPDKTCAQTGITPASPIYISRADCGELDKLTPREMWETLIGDTAHHFGHNDELSDYIALAIMEAYLYRVDTDPAVGLKARYEGLHNGKRIVMNFNPQTRKVTFEGLDRDFSALPGLSAIEGGFKASGRYGSFGCNDMGYVRVVQNGEVGIAWGKTGSHSIYLDGSVTILPQNSLDELRVYIRFEKSEGDECGKGWNSLSFQLLYLPPTPEELETQRLEGNAALVFKAIEEKNWALAETAIREGIPQPRYAEALIKAMQAGAWGLMEAAAESLPENSKLPSLLFSILETRDISQLEKALSNEKLKLHFDFSEKRDYYTPVGYVLTLRNKFPGNASFNEFASKALDLLFAAGAEANADMTTISNVPQNPLNNAVGRPYPSLAVTESILKYLAPEDLNKVDARGRTSMDYLTLYWRVYEKTCLSLSQQNPKAKAQYDRVMAEFNSVYWALKNKGHDGQRRGCLFYRSPSCSYDDTKGLRYGFTTEFQTKSNSSLWICG